MVSLTPEISNRLIIENGVIHRLPQFVNVVSRLLGEKDISPSVRTEVGRALGDKLPGIVHDVSEIVELDGKVKLTTNDERTMYRLGGVVATTLKDLMPKVAVASTNGETTMTIDDMLLINLGTGEHHGGRAWLAAETHAVYELIKSFCYQDIVSGHEDVVATYERYATISSSMNSGEGIDNVSGALMWATSYRQRSHDMAMEKMDEWFKKKAGHMGMGEKFKWRLFFGLWKMVEARGIDKLMSMINENVFNRDGSVKDDVSRPLDSYQKNNEMLSKLEPVLRDSSIIPLE